MSNGRRFPSLRPDDSPPVDTGGVDGGWMDREPSSRIHPGGSGRTLPGHDRGEGGRSELDSVTDLQQVSAPAARREPPVRRPMVQSSVGDVVVADSASIDVAVADPEAAPAEALDGIELDPGARGTLAWASPAARTSSRPPPAGEDEAILPRQPLQPAKVPEPATTPRGPWRPPDTTPGAVGPPFALPSGPPASAPPSVAPGPSVPPSGPVWMPSHPPAAPDRAAGLPPWSLAVAGAVAGALLTALVAWAASGDEPASSAPVASATASASSAPSEPTEIERAAAGDEQALKALAAKKTEQRTVAETMALSRGELAKQLAELHALEAKMRADPRVLHERESQILLRTLAYQQDTFRETLRVLAELPGPESADMLYLIWTGTAARTDATELAEELVHSRDVRAKASPALAIALELRAAETCEERKALVIRAMQHGDQRCLSLLGRLKNKSGCGKDKREDCHACLREELDEAIKAASKRKPPRL